MTPDPELRFCRRVLSAAIVRAVEDAQRGDASARAWLESTGSAWCELLGVESVDWQAAGRRLPAARRELTGSSEHKRAGDRERAMRSYHKRKAERVASKEAARL